MFVTLDLGLVSAVWFLVTVVGLVVTPGLAVIASFAVSFTLAVTVDSVLVFRFVFRLFIFFRTVSLAIAIVFTVVFGDVSAGLVVKSLVLLVAIISLQIHALVIVDFVQLRLVDGVTNPFFHRVAFLDGVPGLNNLVFNCLDQTAEELLDVVAFSHLIFLHYSFATILVNIVAIFSVGGVADLVLVVFALLVVNVIIVSPAVGF